jgi:2-C-methyl-D-erythritol 2,4-cyclodiphosphate synthase
MAQEFRTGVGYDLHRLEPGRKLILGGVEIPFDKGLAGHSDADILMHALTDALLGAASLGDIGELFPPTDPQWKDADSEVFLRQAVELVAGYGYRIVNVDAVVVLERPKVLPHRNAIRENLARILQIDVGRVGLKAKTSEGVGPCGRGEAAEAHAVASVVREAPAKIM